MSYDIYKDQDTHVIHSQGLVKLPSVTPTEGATYFNLLVTSGVGVVATLILAEKLKDKTDVPVNSLILWGTVFAVVTAAGVWSIYKSSK